MGIKIFKFGKGGTVNKILSKFLMAFVFLFGCNIQVKGFKIVLKNCLGDNISFYRFTIEYKVREDGDCLKMQTRAYKNCIVSGRFFLPLQDEINFPSITEDVIWIKKVTVSYEILDESSDDQELLGNFTFLVSELFEMQSGMHILVFKNEENKVNLAIGFPE